MSIVYGVANNDADYQVRKCDWVNGKSIQTWICPYYKTWVQMLVRCYSKNLKTKYDYPCFVCEEWLTFSKFKAWMELQDWQGKQLDKDIIGGESKIYSPLSCYFVDQRLNKFFNLHRNKNKILPTGVHPTKRGKPFCAQISLNNRTTHLGTFDNYKDAHLAWLERKILDLDDKLYQNDLTLTCALVKIKIYMTEVFENKQILTTYWR